MKILYVTTVSRTINAFLIPHIEMLLRKGCTVDCACAIDKPLDRELLAKGVNVFEIPFCRNHLSLGNIKAFLMLKEIERINEYDIIHVHTPVASIYGRLLKLWFHHVKIIYTAHGYHFYKGAPRKNWLTFYPIEKIMAKLTDVTININEEDYEITKNKLKPKKCYLLNGVGLDLREYGSEEVAIDVSEFEENIKLKEIESKDKGNKKKDITEKEIKGKGIKEKEIKEKEVIKREKQDLKESLNIKSRDFVVLMIAEVNENKNHIQLIEAMNLLNKKYHNIKAICVGDGQKLEKMRQEVKARKLEKAVTFLGFREDIKELIEISDIGILLSYREGLPRSLMELMAKGKKIIATDIRGCRDLVENEDVGTLVQVGDHEATAKAIEKYYKERNREFHAPQEVMKYDVRAVVKDVEGVYKEFMEEETEAVKVRAKIRVEGGVGV